MSKEKLNTRAAAVVALAVMSSRLLGLARELILAALFGAGRGMDAYITAFRAPNLLRDLFAEGALSVAFVTVFSKLGVEKGVGAAWLLARKMATLTLVFMTIVTALGIIFAGPLIGLLAPGFDPDKSAFTVELTRIMFPFILLVSLAALVMGMLNSRNVFGMPALASSFFNLGSIIGGVAVAWLIDPHFGPRALTGIAVGTLIGGLLQLLVQLPSLREVGFTFAFDFRWRDPQVKRVLILMLPAVIAASAVQVNVMVNSVFASYLGDGAVSWLSYAFRLMQLPLGIFGVAIATVTLPAVSKIAAGGDMAHFCQTLGKALRLALFLTLPATVGLVLLSDEIIGLIYQRGKFSPADTFQTGAALKFYAAGLMAYACIKVLSPAFYALDRRWTPMMVSFVSIAMNIFLNWQLTFRLGMGHRGLALSTGLSAIANFLLLYFFMRRAAGGMPTASLLGSFARMLLAAGGLAAACVAGRHFLAPWLASAALIDRLWSLLAVIGVGAAVYFGLCALLRVEETSQAIAIAKRKINRRAIGSPGA
ncbi:MAG: murein biosynthesis integral membrane protein MurJ [Chthoniobacterales bacterium]|nr:murein biosynthesis integral membrane protein MurJ [Chthoniobacterales bacterium]